MNINVIPDWIFIVLFIILTVDQVLRYSILSKTMKNSLRFSEKEINDKINSKCMSIVAFIAVIAYFVAIQKLHPLEALTDKLLLFTTSCLLLAIVYAMVILLMCRWILDNSYLEITKYGNNPYLKTDNSGVINWISSNVAPTLALVVPDINNVILRFIPNWLKLPYKHPHPVGGLMHDFPTHEVRLITPEGKLHQQISKDHVQIQIVTTNDETATYLRLPGQTVYKL